MVSFENEKTHLHLLLNKNKSESSFYFDCEEEEVVINDGLLDKVEIVLNEPKKMKGAWLMDEKCIQ